MSRDTNTKDFKEDIDLDAKLLYAGMQGGIDQIMNTAFLMRDKINANDVVARCEWFKVQPKSYQDRVIKLVIQKENQNPELISK